MNILVVSVSQSTYALFLNKVETYYYQLYSLVLVMIKRQLLFIVTVNVVFSSEAKMSRMHFWKQRKKFSKVYKMGGIL